MSHVGFIEVHCVIGDKLDVSWGLPTNVGPEVLCLVDHGEFALFIGSY